MVKNPPANEGDMSSIPGSGRYLGEGNGVEENLLQFPAWKIPWTEKPGRLQSMELQRTVHDQATEYACTYHCIIILCSLVINEKESKTKNPNCLLNEML